MKHTPGPWEVEGEGQNVVGILAVGDEHYIAKLSGWVQPRQDANARLISAAPALLESCRHLCETLRPYIMSLGVKKGYSEMVALAEANKAINKATGE